MLKLLQKLFRPTQTAAREQTWARPAGEEFADLPEDAVAFMQAESKCPYCKSELYNGPRGGMAINLFCGNPDCNSRFNIADPSMAPIPWGQFTGTCPDDFIEWRRNV